MILVTVGSAPHPFTRLVRAAEHLAAETGKEVVIQYGFTQVPLKHARGFDFVPYEEMNALYKKADVIISHASAGPILFAEKFHKPLILFPRSGDLGEHVDNHQLEFAKALQRDGSGFEIIYEESELLHAFDNSLLAGRRPAFPHQRQRVAGELRNYLQTLERVKWERSRNSVWRKFKELLYYLRIYRFFASLWNHTFWTLRRGYRPKDFWNGWSSRYIKEKARGAIGPSHWWLLEKLKRYAGGKILEAGCSYGSTLQFLSQNLGPETSLHGADISTSMLHYACTHLPADTASRVVCADLGGLPFLDQSFDLVFTRGVLMHCPEAAMGKVLRELERVSKGDLILVEEAFWDQEAHQGKTFSLNEYTFIHDYVPMLLKAGWEIIEKKSVDEGMVVLICLVCRKTPSKRPLRAADAEGVQGGLIH